MGCPRLQPVLCPFSGFLYAIKGWQREGLWINNCTELGVGGVGPCEVLNQGPEDPKYNSKLCGSCDQGDSLKWGWAKGVMMDRSEERSVLCWGTRENISFCERDVFGGSFTTVSICFNVLSQG